MPEPKINLLLDSGAYSAFKLGKPVSLERYCDFLEANKDWITNYVALDVIRPGDTEAGAAESFKNLQYMRKRGLDPMAVFHIGEDIKWLHAILDLGCTYIGLGGSAILANKAVDPWYTYVWGHLVNSEGLPIVKVHALGEGKLESLRRYPWASADTTSWLYTAQKTARTTLPGGNKISMRNDGLSTKAAPDARLLAEDDGCIFSDYLFQENIDQAVMQDDKVVAWFLRSYIMVKYFLDFEKKVNAQQPVRFFPQGFLHQGCSGRTSALIDQFRLHFVININYGAYVSLMKAGATAGLCSYFYMDKHHHAETLKAFIFNPYKAMRAHKMGNKYVDLMEAGFK